MAESDRLLEGVTVLDFSRVLAGPYCTRLLADLGARVIKIERPGEGDEMRRAPVQLEPGRDDQSSYFTRVNAGKLSVGLDLNHPRAPEVVRDLARVADVAVENFMPGVAARLGCDHAALARVRPDLVYCSISGFGQTGPLAAAPAFHHIANALSGIVHLESQPDAAPRVGYLQSADVLAGTHAFGAILAALWRRSRTGQGAFLDVSMLQALIAAEDISYGAMLNGGAQYPGPRAGMLLHAVGGQWLATQIVGAPQLWSRLCVAMARPDLLQDPRYATAQARRERWAEIRGVIAAWLDTFPTRDAALAALAAARLPAAPVLSPAEVIAHPHLAERQAFPAVPHPARGTVRVTASPFHLDGAPVAPAGPAPYRVGEHTREVLRDVLGYDEERIETLRKDSAIALP